MSNIKVIIDCRELKIKDYFDTSGFFESKPICSYSNLDIGDFQFFINEQLVMIVERKTISDLISSIKDGRYKEQKCRLLNNYPSSKVFYLLEGYVDSKIKRQCYNIDIVYGSILNTLLRDKIKIIHSKDLQETCRYIELIIKRLEKNPEFFNDNTDNAQLSYENSIKINKKQNMTPQLCQLTQLAQIPGLSVNSAKCVIEKYGSIKNLIQQYSNLDEDSGKLLLKDIECKSRKLGKVLSARIYEYINLD